uniref:Probable G-protein coupled receptor No18 n=1 Tax=Dermatophagoides pteronyssinus TaxID=6956 RepID=A0A6P6YMC0_DERPT|nr:probable G-protein coupled receptor No18 [Dermatophagoides pteronyssinus]
MNPSINLTSSSSSSSILLFNQDNNNNNVFRQNDDAYDDDDDDEVFIASTHSTTSTNDNDDDDLWSRSHSEIIFRLIGAIICVALIIVTIVGNVLVIIVVVRFHRMRTVTNILLASLAIADITVASLVMPFTVVYDLYRFWPWGPVLCHFWISCDVMCCTASILHLCCVAIDRFWAITRPLRYRSLISKRRLFCCILSIWLCSAAISFIPIFSGWYHSQGPINIFTLEYVNECGLDVNRIYATISSLTSFYLPLPIMFYVYLRILLVAERQSREIKQLEQSLRQNGFLSMNYPTTTTTTPAMPQQLQQRKSDCPMAPITLLQHQSTTPTSITLTPAAATAAETETINKSNGQNVHFHFSSLLNVNQINNNNDNDDADESCSPNKLSLPLSSTTTKQQSLKTTINYSSSMDLTELAAISSKGTGGGRLSTTTTTAKNHHLVDQTSLETSKRHVERSLRRRARQLITDTKAIRTLGIVMGVFCLCWLPFFIMYVISAYCDQCNISYELRSGITWLGYVNSALNPAIYAYLNKEFKMAFKRVLFCMPHCNNDNFDRDTMLDEYSNASHRHVGGGGSTGAGGHRTTKRINEHHHFGFMIDTDEGGGGAGGGPARQSSTALDIIPLPSTPGYLTRTPSNATETPNWIILHAQQHHQQQQQQLADNNGGSS